MNNKARKKIYIALLIFIVTSVVSAGLFRQLLWSPFLNLAQGYSADQLELSILEQKADLLRELRKDFEVISRNVDDINGAFLSSENLLFFLESVEEIARDAGIAYNVKSVTEINPKRAGGSPAAIVLNTNIEGSFSTFRFK